MARVTTRAPKKPLHSRPTYSRFA